MVLLWIFSCGCAKVVFNVHAMCHFAAVNDVRWLPTVNSSTVQAQCFTLRDEVVFILPVVVS